MQKVNASTSRASEPPRRGTTDRPLKLGPASTGGLAALRNLSGASNGKQGTATVWRVFRWHTGCRFLQAVAGVFFYAGNPNAEPTTPPNTPMPLSGESRG